MRAFQPVTVAAVLLALALADCGEGSNVSEQAATGPNPTLPEPSQSLIPTVNIPPAKGWAR
jgi:hypothetical protein